MAGNINGVNIPASMATPPWGHYQYTEGDEIAQNGNGDIVEGDFATITWTFPKMYGPDYLWWRTTLLGGNASLLITSASLWDDTGALISFTSGVVKRPRFDSVSNNYYNNVVITIEDLL